MKKITRIAIVGPDGAGKTSVANDLQSKIQNSIVLYAGKKKGHFLLTTKWAFFLWKNSKRFPIPLLADTILYFILYPLEYLENFYRFNIRIEDKYFYIYDRHPIDRMILSEELKRNRYGKSNLVNIMFNPKYYVLLFWKSVYYYLFPKIDMIFLLVPEESLCFERAKGQYSNIQNTRVRIESYVCTAKLLKNKEHITYIDIDIEKSIEDISDEIIEILK